MAVKKIEISHPLPQFDLPEKYMADEWNIKEWDYYRNAEPKRQSVWRSRSSVTNHILKFTLCKNPHIAEEYKYFMYYLIEIKQIQIAAFAEYYDRYKVLAEYVNKYMVGATSILELDDIASFEKSLQSRGNKTTIKNGTQFVGGEIIPVEKKNRYSTFVIKSQLVIRDYYERDIPEENKLIWHANRLPFALGKEADRTLDFRGIKNPILLADAKEFCKYLLTIRNISFSATYEYLHSIKTLYEWLDKYHPLKTLKEIDRDIIEDYMLYLRTSGKRSSHAINVHILNTKTFFDWGEFADKKLYMPEESPLFNKDYAFKTKKESKYLTKEEMKGIFEAISHMPKLYGRIVYCLIFMGVRYSELAKLPIDRIKQDENGKYYLDIWQTKTYDMYEKPIYQNCVNIMLQEIERNKKRFGAENVKYVFVGKKNKPIRVGTVNEHINRALKEINFKGRNGKILHCTTHQFRATFATTLVSEGEAVTVAAQLLGHRTLSGTSHYVAVAPEKVKEQLRPRLEKDEVLIRNIGKMEELKELPTTNTVALCNGFCSKNPITSPCAKANACYSCSLFVPSKEFLNMYEIQLTEIEATIQIAELNGYELMLEKALEDKHNLLNVLDKLKRIGEKNYD